MSHEMQKRMEDSNGGHLGSFTNVHTKASRRIKEVSNVFKSGDHAIQVQKAHSCKVTIKLRVLSIHLKGWIFDNDHNK